MADGGAVLLGDAMEMARGLMVGSKMARKMLCFTIETALVGCGWK